MIPSSTRTSTADDPASPSCPRPFWARAAEEVAADVGAQWPEGLSAEDVRQRRLQYGTNQLRTAETRSRLTILAGQFKSFVVVLLMVAAVVALALGEPIDAAAIAIVIVVNAAIGYVTESRAVRSMESLRALGSYGATVRRDGEAQTVPAEDLVPGDILILDAGDVLTADARIVSAAALQADESALTGESVPVQKSVDSVLPETTLAERSCMLYKGTAVTHGSAEAVVVHTGMRTEIGVISELVIGAESRRSPLEEDMAQLGRHLALLTGLLAVFVALAALSTGRGGLFALQLGVALAVATIPEGLPVVMTVALARGMARMAQRNALVENLSAVETLGCTSVLMTDKTGTLTENQMTAVSYALPGGDYTVTGVGLESRGEFRLNEAAVNPEESWELSEALRVGVLCTNASVRPTAEESVLEGTGDPTEVALLVAGAKAGGLAARWREELPEVSEIPFDSSTKRMATLHDEGEGTFAAVKGAPEAVMAACTSLAAAASAETRPMEPSERAAWLARAEDLAGSGMRVLGLARGRFPSPGAFEFAGLEWLGLVVLSDPPRASARTALEAIHRAGIMTVMVTGDHCATAAAIAREVGLVPPSKEAETLALDASQDDLGLGSPGAAPALLKAAVIARATPRQKLDLIELHQAAGHVVGMIGDGVNDAPALKRADIGIAMGLRGTQVAREASSMVLRDDQLGSVVVAIREGRAIFANVRRFVVYLLSCNSSEVMVASAGAMLTGPLPILPVHILFLNMVTDVFPALALGVCKGAEGAMDEPPRPKQEPLLSAGAWWRILFHGVLMASCVFGSLLVADQMLQLPEAQVTTTAFLTLAMAQLWHVFTMRGRGVSLLRSEVTRNRYVWGALVLCLALLVGAVTHPLVSKWLSLENPGAPGWAFAFAFSWAPVLAAQLARACQKNTRWSIP